MKDIFHFKSIKGKIIFGFSIVFAMLIVMIVLNHFGLKKINNQTVEIVDTQFPLALANRAVTLNIAETAADIRGYMVYKDEQLLVKLNETIENGKEIEAHWLSLTNFPKSRELAARKGEWTQLILNAAKAGEKGQDKQAKAYLQEALPLTNELNDSFSELLQKREATIAEAGEQIKKTGKSTDTFIILLGVAVLAVGIIIAFITARTITQPIQMVMSRMKTIATGDLSEEPLKPSSKDETAQLTEAMNVMSANTRDLLNQISQVSQVVSSQSEELTQSASEVKVGTEQIATTMEELASGAETQANTSSELSSLMNLFAQKVGNANESGELVQQHSANVLELTSKGSALMHTSSEQMNKINQIVRESVRKVENLDHQSQEISNLVSVIKAISEQTNLLALNAAIEAARAGEQGKGFAVVADEVRKLAEQVAFSVNDITEIVGNIQTESSTVVASLRDGFTEVEQGTSQIETTEATFHEITNAVNDMARNIESVSENLSEIAASSEEMGGSIQEIAAVSEEAAAGIEETAASAEQASGSMEEVAGSSEQLARLAEELNEMVGRFRI